MRYRKDYELREEACLKHRELGETGDHLKVMRIELYRTISLSPLCNFDKRFFKKVEWPHFEFHIAGPFPSPK